jgi:Tol biopolymer transport system component
VAPAHVWRASKALGLGVALFLAGCSVANNGSPTGTGDLAGLRLGVFASDRGHATGQYDIYLWDYDLLAFRAVPGLNYTSAERHPSLSSDGRFIAFQTNRGGGAGDDIEIYDRKAQGYVSLPGLNTANDESDPAFTGDGKKLCYAQGAQGSAFRRVKLYDGVTKAPIALPGIDVAGTYSDYSPAPNFDGSLIAFVSTRNGNPDIFVYDRSRGMVLDGPELRAALVSAGDDVDPSFSTTARFLTFASNRAGSQGGYDVYLLEFAVTQTRTDTLLRDVSAANGVADDRHPSVGDNGNIIVFQSNRGVGQGGWDLWNFDRTNVTVTQLGTGYNSTSDDIEPSIKWPY